MCEFDLENDIDFSVLEESDVTGSINDIETEGFFEGEISDEIEMTDTDYMLNEIEEWENERAEMLESMFEDLEQAEEDSEPYKVKVKKL